MLLFLEFLLELLVGGMDMTADNVLNAKPNNQAANHWGKDELSL